MRRAVLGITRAHTQTVFAVTCMTAKHGGYPEKLHGDSYEWILQQPMQISVLNIARFFMPWAMEEVASKGYRDVTRFVDDILTVKSTHNGKANVVGNTQQSSKNYREPISSTM